MIRHTLLFIISIFTLPLFAQQSRIELLHANSLEYDERKTGKVKRLIGDVRFKQNTTLLYCDSAYQFDDANRIEAFGKVHINHKDSIHFYSNKLIYEGNSRQAYLEENVRMVEPNMTLTTDKLFFDLNSNTGYYTTGGNMTNGTNTLTSTYGYYYANKKEMYFKKDVVLNSTKYNIETDTLRYNTNSKEAYFFGPTHIIGKKNRLYCENGIFNTATDVARFSKNAYVLDEDKLLKADSIYYDNQKEFGKAWRQIQIIDYSNKTVLYGSEGVLLGYAKQQIITKNALAKQFMEDDSMYLFADTIHSFQTFKTQQASVRAYRKVTVIKSDMQARCDSLVYTKVDSMITLYHKPILWSGLNQATADTILLYINNNKLDSFKLLFDGFLVSREGAKEFNQVKGKYMSGVIEKSKFKYMYVAGNAQSINYVKEDSTYSGVNVLDCSEMEFYFKDNKIERSTFLTKPDATFYPINELKPDELRLKGFKWRSKDRPDLKQLLSRFAKSYNDLNKN